MAPYGDVPPSTVPRLHSASGHPLQLLLLVCPQLICSRIIMVCPSQVPTLSSSIIFFSFVIDLFLHLADSHLLWKGAGAGGVTPAALRQCKTSSWNTTRRTRDKEGTGHRGHGSSLECGILTKVVKIANGAERERVQRVVPFMPRVDFLPSAGAVCASPQLATPHLSSLFPLPLLVLDSTFLCFLHLFISFSLYFSLSLVLLCRTLLLR